MMGPLVSNAAPFPASNPIGPGQVLAGKYRVERVLGQGGMGVVVEARHIALDERVALKFLLPEFATHPEASTRFLREARAAVKIKSEHVARVSDVGTLPESGAPYMVMEFLEGRDLSQQLERDGVLSIVDAIDYLIQGCEAIAEAHSYGIVHRESKPANLFLSKRPDGTPHGQGARLRHLQGQERRGRQPHQDHRLDGLGALHVARADEADPAVDHRADVYALGITLYELLGGRQPFVADTLPQLCAEVLTGSPVPLRSLRADVSEQLAAVMARAYARDPAERFQSVAEFVVALAPFAPACSQTTVERVARMGGVTLPAPGTSGFFTAPGQPQQGSPSTVQLPVMDPTTGQGAPQGWQPSTMGGAPPYPPAQPAPVIGAAPAPPTANGPPSQMVPGHYTGPMSVRAAASFAQGGTTNANLSTTNGPSAGSKAGVFALVAVALLAVGGGLVWAFVLRPGAKQAHAQGAEAPVVSVSTPAPTAPPAAPPPATTPASSVMAIQPAAAPPAVEAPKPSTEPETAPSAAASAHPHGGHAPAAPVRAQPQAPMVPVAPQPAKNPLDHM